MRLRNGSSSPIAPLVIHNDPNFDQGPGVALIVLEAAILPLSPRRTALSSLITMHRQFRWNLLHQPSSTVGPSALLMRRFTKPSIQSSIYCSKLLEKSEPTVYAYDSSMWYVHRDPNRYPHLMIIILCLPEPCTIVMSVMFIKPVRE